mmetsp:Transcript_8109/g.12260  ORF Transcript_8109/g.12260 Transcript_8109/m.12260 type:complete len:221 (-) Transcript_8109:2292-2954(-)
MMTGLSNAVQPSTTEHLSSKILDALTTQQRNKVFKGNTGSKLLGRLTSCGHKAFRRNEHAAWSTSMLMLAMQYKPHAVLTRLVTHLVEDAGSLIVLGCLYWFLVQNVVQVWGESVRFWSTVVGELVGHQHVAICENRSNPECVNCCWGVEWEIKCCDLWKQERPQMRWKVYFSPLLSRSCKNSGTSRTRLATYFAKTLQISWTLSGNAVRPPSATEPVRM